MIVTARRLRSMGWIATLVVCAALVMVLAFRVNALRSQVHQSQARIIALKQETMYLETEFETRANQQQLKAWNDVEFGYVAPTASQYLDTERQLASYAKPAEPDAPAPVRVASADAPAPEFPAMVSPITGKTMGEGGGATDRAVMTPAKAGDSGDDAPATGHGAKLVRAVASVGLAGLGDRLGTVHPGAGARSASVKPAVHKAAKVATTKSAKTKAHLASAAETHGHSAMGKKSGAMPIKLALKDAKAIK